MGFLEFSFVYWLVDFRRLFSRLGCAGLSGRVICGGDEFSLFLGDFGF